MRRMAPRADYRKKGCRWVKMRFTTFRFYNQQVVIISPPVLTFRGAVTQAHGRGRRWGSAGLVFWAQSAVVGPCLWTFSADQHVESGTEAFSDRIHSDWLFRLGQFRARRRETQGSQAVNDIVKRAPTKVIILQSHIMKPSEQEWCEMAGKQCFVSYLTIIHRRQSEYSFSIHGA